MQHCIERLVEPTIPEQHLIHLPRVSAITWTLGQLFHSMLSMTIADFGLLVPWDHAAPPEMTRVSC